MSEERVYPAKRERREPDLSRRWLVTCTNLIFEGGGMGTFQRSFRSRAVARVWAWWIWYIGSYKGEGITITDQEGER